MTPQLIDAQIRNIQDEASSQVEKILTESSKHVDLLYKLRDVLPILKTTLISIGFNITDISSRRTGIYNDGDKLIVSLKLTPISPNFKFVKFDGYNKNGGGRNNKKLRAKADKFNALVLSQTGIDLDFNQYSFEESKYPEYRTILAEFLIKK